MSPRIPGNSPYTYTTYLRRKNLLIKLYASFRKDAEVGRELESEISRMEKAKDSPNSILCYLYELIGDVIYED